MIVITIVIVIAMTAAIAMVTPIAIVATAVVIAVGTDVRPGLNRGTEPAGTTQHHEHGENSEQQLLHTNSR